MTENTWDKPLLERLRRHAKRITIEDRVYYRVEGDLLLDEHELQEYALEREAAEGAGRKPQQGDLPLVATLDAPGGKIVRWAPEVELSYAVLRSSFQQGGGAGYELVVDATRKAATAWEETCGIQFKYKAELDTSDALMPLGALFVVREFDAGGAFIASAFFPNDPSHRRRVLVDPSFYAANLGFDRVGVLRHELGHVLGFRHEHIRKDGAPPGCPDEDTDGTVNLGDYDPRSVMHYFCGGLGSKDLKITDFDRKGAQQVYGQPLANFRLVR